MECDEEIQEASDRGFYSESGSWASQYLSTSPSDDSNDLIPGKKENSWHKCRPTIVVESQSTEAEDKSSCEICKLQEADTCVVHLVGTHSSFCLDCATRYYAAGKFCPMCAKLIVYFYKYRNI